jgi:hypothetical protein
MKRFMAVLLVTLGVMGTLGGVAHADPITHVQVGTNQRDTLIGTNDRDTIFGKQRGDILVGLGGQDALFGNRGWDRIDAVDGHKDLVVGGVGRDRCYVDRIDVVDTCEFVVVVTHGNGDLPARW